MLNKIVPILFSLSLLQCVGFNLSEWIRAILLFIWFVQTFNGTARLCQINDENDGKCVDKSWIFYISNLIFNSRFFRANLAKTNEKNLRIIVMGFDATKLHHPITLHLFTWTFCFRWKQLNDWYIRHIQSVHIYYESRSRYWVHMNMDNKPRFTINS